ncbi:MAG: insulinase family protein [Oscillospiraceae bacterium]|nr:insulinase family protein [Oscillospiraceae bacterium]
MERTEYPALGETVFSHTLGNGLRIIAVPKPGFMRSHAIFAAHYGGADRRFRLGGEWIDTPAGVAHFLEHKMFDMPDGSNVLAELSSRGASPNAFTSSDVTAYHFTCTDGFSQNLETLLTYVSTPFFTEESVRKEQGIISQEIRMYENSPDAVGYYEMMGALYARHPVRENVVGTVESIAEITPETLYNCHKVFYNPSNMVLCCVGDVDPEAVAETAERILPADPGPIPERDYGPAEDPLPAGSRAGRAMEVSAPLFFAGAKVCAPASGSERLRVRLLGELALDYLVGPSSAFYTELYARGLLDRTFGCELDDAAGAMTVLMGGQSRDPEAVMTALEERIGLIARRGVDGAAFDRCRRARYGLQLGSLDRFSEYAGLLFRGCMRGWNPLDIFSMLGEITPEDAAAFLCENLRAERTAMSVIRPENG